MFSSTVAALVAKSVTLPPLVASPVQPRFAAVPPLMANAFELANLNSSPVPETRPDRRLMLLPVSRRVTASPASTRRPPALMALVPDPLAWSNCPAAAISLTVPSMPAAPEPSATPARALIAPETVKELPAAVSVMLPALPPCPSLLAAALAPVVMMLPTTRLPALPVPVVVSVTMPDVTTLDALRVSMVVLLASMLGAVMVMAAPPVVMPVGFTVPIVRAVLVVSTTAPVADEAKVEIWFSGALCALARFSVNLPEPDRPSFETMMAPVCVTASPADRIADAPVCNEPTIKPFVSLTRTAPPAPVVVFSVAVLPAEAVSAALRTDTLSVPISLLAFVRMTPAPALESVLIVRLVASTKPLPNTFVASVSITPPDVSVTVPVDWIWLTDIPLVS